MPKQINQRPAEGGSLSPLAYNEQALKSLLSSRRPAKPSLDDTVKTAVYPFSGEMDEARSKLHRHHASKLAWPQAGFARGVFGDSSADSTVRTNSNQYTQQTIMSRE